MSGRNLGEYNGRSKLDKYKVREIRRLAGKGWSHARLSIEFEVSKSCITAVLSGLTWGDVE